MRARNVLFLERKIKSNYKGFAREAMEYGPLLKMGTDDEELWE